MNYLLDYDYDNYYGTYECKPAVRHGTCFELFNCRVKFYQLEEKSIIFYVDNTIFSKQEVEEKCKYVAKILTYMFALPIYSRDCYIRESNFEPTVNDLLSKESLIKIRFIEKKINRFKTTRVFFDEMLDLLIVGYDNLFNRRDEDAYVYFFKVIERIAKEHYLSYMERHHKKEATASNKKELKRLITQYTSERLLVTVTEDIMNSRIDLIYKNIKQDFYGSVYNKISLFINRYSIPINLNVISDLVHTRNKIAHGDIIDNQSFQELLGACEYLMMQMFSYKFFNKNYMDIHIRSYRYNIGEEVWK